jgi:hypothetical protein
VHGGSGVSFGVIEALRRQRPGQVSGIGASAGPGNLGFCSSARSAWR